MSNQLITQSVTAENVTGLASHFVKSGWFKDTTDISKAVVKIMAGQELGVGPMAAMTGINIIQGKPVMSSNLLAAQIKNSGKYNYKVLTRTSDLCEIEFYERFTDKFESVGKASFSFEEAKGAGLTNKDNWKNYASDMLFARAISRGARTYCPDVFNGSPVYVPGEIEEPQATPNYIEEEVLSNIIRQIEELASITGKPVSVISQFWVEHYKVESLDLLSPSQGKQLLKAMVKKVQEAKQQQANVPDLPDPAEVATEIFETQEQYTNPSN